MTEQKKDFRKQLYDAYVTTFKSHISSETTEIDNSLFAGYRKVYLQYLINFSKDASILDLGCGNGLMLQFLKTEGFQNLYGIDISEQQVAIARRRGLVTDSIDAFSFFLNNKDKFDIVFAMDIIEHLQKEELFEFFKGIFELLNDDGVLLIHTPNGDGIFPNHIIYGDLTHLTVFNPNSIGQILRLIGFTDIKCFETGPTTKNMLGTIRLILWKLIRLIFMSLRIIETGGTEKILTQDFICISKKKKVL